MPDQASRDIPKNRNTSRQDFEAATTGGAMGGSSDGGATPGTIAGSMEQTGTTVEQARNMVRNLGEQARFLGLLWLFCGVEGWLCSRIVNRYGDYPQQSLLKRLCDKTLLRHVSEWELLFTRDERQRK